MKQLLKILIISALFQGLLMATVSIAADKSTTKEALNLDDLLNKLAQGQYQQSLENKKREREFVQKKAKQQQLLRQSISRRDAQVARSEKLETNFEENEIKIAGLEEALNKRLGSLKELFGVLQQVSGDANTKLTHSIISAQYPGRTEFFTKLAEKMGSASELASIGEIEKVWFELQKEMTESGKVTRFKREVTLADGKKVNATVIRVGTFNLISDGKYLDWDGKSETVSVLNRQPSSRFLATAEDLENATTGLTSFALDPTGGSILRLLVQEPSIEERVEQGGSVGYVIIALGIIALLIGLERYIVLFMTERKVKRQLKASILTDDNPLGRVLKVKEKYAHVTEDTLELKLSEAILKEIPRLVRGISFIKIISVVSPLLGLLGTVTGMINTFQAITLFGTGDPKLMAGGISTALVTTVLGLIVAIPTVMLYTWLNTRSKNILHIIQEQSAGIIAERAEESELLDAPNIIPIGV